MNALVSRRRVLLSVGAVVAAPAAPAIFPHADAELIALGGEFDRLFARWTVARVESRRTEELRFRALVSAGLAEETEDGPAFNHYVDNASRAKFEEISASTGHHDAWAAWSEAEAALSAVADRIADVEPTTPAGLAVRARVVLWEHFSGSMEDDWREPVDNHEARLVAVLDLATRLGGASVLA